MTWNMLPVSELIEGAVDQHVESNRFSEVWKLVTGLCLGSRRRYFMSNCDFYHRFHWSSEHVIRSSKGFSTYISEVLG
jgi:hypothetical protein